MRIVQECKLTGGRGCQVNAQMVVSSWQRTVGGKHVAVFGTLQASGTGGHRKNVHSHNTTSTLITDDNPLYIRFISPPSIREDNRAVKIKPVCPLAVGALYVCVMNVDGARFMVISSQGRQCYAGLGGHEQVKHKGEL